MRKSNGSNGIPEWAQVLKGATVSLIEGQRQSRQEMAEFRRDMVEMRQESQKRFAENEKMIAEMVRRNDKLEQQTATLKKVSDIHTKAIMRIVDKL